MARHSRLPIVPASLAVLLATLAVAFAGCSSANNQTTLPTSQRGGVMRSLPSVRQTSKKTLYVSDLETNTVTLFAANVPSPAPITTITAGLEEPEGIWVDAGGTLYVANSATRGHGSGNVTVYPAGSLQPSLTLNSSDRPMSVVTDSQGNVYVGSNTARGSVSISEYAPGGTSPIKTVAPTTLSGAPFMGGLAVDQKDDIYAAFFVYDNPPAHVVEFGPGLINERDLNLSGLDTVDLDPGLARDKRGNLYVGGTLAGINVYAPGSTKVKRSISGGDSQFFTVSPQGALYDPTTYYVYEFAPKAQQPRVTFRGSLQYPVGTALH
jgi:hypothetical protein